jgi:protein-S-isoprenylcysteine O-methyltransferase Ste14
MNYEILFLISLNVAYLAALYLVPKYLSRQLSKHKMAGRYRFALIFLSIGLIQTTSFLGYAVIPAYLLLIGYLFCGGAILLKFLQHYEISQSISWAIVVLFQIPIYTLLGYFFGIFHEHYGGGKRGQATFKTY